MQIIRLTLKTTRRDEKGIVVYSPAVLLRSSWAGSVADSRIYIGHGSYQMSDMEDFLNKMELPVSNAQVTDNFPGYVTQDTRVGLEWSRHHAGVLFNYMNTAGKKGITDYSGSCNFELRNKGYKLGAFYRFRLVKEEISIFTFEPYIQLSTGVVLNKVHEANRLFIESVPTAGYLQEGHFSSKNFFVGACFRYQVRSVPSRRAECEHCL